MSIYSCTFAKKLIYTRTRQSKKGNNITEIRIHVIQFASALLWKTKENEEKKSLISENGQWNARAIE